MIANPTQDQEEEGTRSSTVTGFQNNNNELMKTKKVISKQRTTDRTFRILTSTRLGLT